MVNLNHNHHGSQGAGLLTFAKDPGGAPARPKSGAPGMTGAGQEGGQAALKAERGPLAGRQFPLTHSPFAVGRVADNDLVLPEAAVSRHHVRLERRGARWTVQDLGSANGTFVNRQRLQQPVPLNDGDQIAIGDSVLVFQEAGAARVPAGRARPAVAQPSRRPSPLVGVVIAVAVIALVVVAILLISGQITQEDEGLPGPALPTVQLPTIQIPTVTLPTLELPAELPIPTALPAELAPLQTALPGLELPEGLPPLPGSQ